MAKKVGYLLVITALLIIVVVLYLNSNYHSVTRVFSPYSIMRSSWEKYKKQFMNKEGRVIDYSQNSVTTSEGQSYALLRAVWVDDKVTFDQVWKWTKDTMKRPKDELFGWRWGKNKNGEYGFLSDGGENSAADADSDIALALIFAGNRWSDDNYIQEAKKILNDMWKIETGVSHGKRYLVAGNWAVSKTELVVNPSYFAPYAWRIFAKIDKEHDWMSLVDPAYNLLTVSGQAQLDKSKGVGLPPDWVKINTDTDQIAATGISGISTNYSFDAMRVPWRVAIDYIWNKDQKAYDYLSHLQFLGEYYQKESKLVGSYSHDGTPLTNVENPSMYATSLGYFIVMHPDMAQQIYQEKIIKLYSNPDSTFNQDLPYYEQNWLWFGVGLYNKQLPPLS